MRRRKIEGVRLDILMGIVVGNVWKLANGIINGRMWSILLFSVTV
jgi:hypothetical protein